MRLLDVNDRAGQHPPSHHAATATPLPPQPVLTGAHRADVAVVGGGYTGLSAALHLAERGYRTVLLDAHRAGFGASGRNGGQLGSGQRVGQDRLETMLGRAHAARLWQLGEEAKALVHDLIARHAMDCAVTPGIVEACWHARDVAHAHATAERLARDHGYDRITLLDRAGIADIVRSGAYRGGTLDQGAGHLQPLAFALGLARAAQAAGAQLFDSSRVTAITRGPVARLHCAQGHVDADHVIIATNGYHDGLVPEVAARVMPINNFIVATEPLAPGTVLTRDVAVADSKFVINYFRLAPDGRLLFGGGESYGDRFPADIRAKVRAPMLAVFPQLQDAQLTHAWGGTLAITANRLPHFARIAPNMLSAAGYSGHGVGTATLAGRIMARAVAGQAENFDVMAALPVPRFPGGPALRRPLLALAMSWFALRDRLGV